MADGQGTASIQEEVTKLIGENAQLSKSLKTIQAAETSLLSERERLVANATNMSIMLADSRAKVDFLQMQLEEYKNGSLSNSAHDLGSQSDHGFNNAPKRGFRKLAGSLTASGNAAAGGGSAMGDNSERSVGSVGGSRRGERFRSFLQNRTKRPGTNAGPTVDNNSAHG